MDGLLVAGHSTTETDLNLLVAEHAGLLQAAATVYSHSLNVGMSERPASCICAANA